MASPLESANDPGPASASGLLHPGMTLSGRYFIEKELGRGGIGVVYLATDRQLMSRSVVVKVLLEQSYQDEWIKKKFRQEIEALARIDHAGVVSVFDAGEMPDGKPYLVMQYIEGTPLRQHLGKPMEMGRVGRLIRQISQALAAAHEKGVLHRDLKPENVMIITTSAGMEETRLIDFGLAKIQDSQVGESSVVSNVAGSFGYMAPEQLLSRPATAASDIYSLAVITYEMLTGRRPFLPESIFELYEMQRRGLETRPRQLRPELPAAAENVLLQALAFDPKQRPAGVQEFGSQMVRFLESALETEVHEPVPQLQISTAKAPAPVSWMAIAPCALAVIALTVLAKVSFFRFSAWQIFFVKPQFFLLLALIALYAMVFIRFQGLRKALSLVMIGIILLSAGGILWLPPVVQITSVSGKLFQDEGSTLNYSDPKGYKYTFVEERYCVISIDPGRFNDLTDYSLSLTLTPEISFADVYFDRAFHLTEPLLLQQPSNTNDTLLVVMKGDHFAGVRTIKFSYKYRVPPKNKHVTVSIKTDNQDLRYDGEIIF